jgi:aspartate aminotransferase
MKLTERAKRIRPSATMAVTNKAKAMRASGIDVIDLGVGEPDFDTPIHIKKAAHEAMEKGHTRYTPAGGIDALKGAIIDRTTLDLGLSYRKEEVVVSCGGKHALYNLALALFDKGDEVIVLTPYWVSYPIIVDMAGGTPVLINTKADSDFKVRIEDLEKAITSRTKAIVLNSPSNPTGTVYLPDELEKIAELAVARDIFVISDDIYMKLLYKNTPFTHIASFGPEIKARTIFINGVSKAYAMTGWRIGYAGGPEEVIGAMTRIQSQTTSCPNSIAQLASVEALTGPQEVVQEMINEFDRRRIRIVEGLQAIEGIQCFDPIGAFYVFPNVSAFFGKRHREKTVDGSTSLSEYLLEEARVAVVPGIEFGSDDHVRLSYATSFDNIQEALTRIESALDALGQGI